MSLLLEALKKAEKAKEEAQRRARGEPEAPAAELRLEAEEAASSRAAAPVMTRDQLPDIRQPLEIQADEPPPRPAPKAPPPPPQAAERKPAADAQAGSRAAARKVFEAKFREPNPRLHRPSCASRASPPRRPRPPSR